MDDGNGRGAEILLVEDNPDSRELMASLIRRMRSRVTTTGSVEEALEHLRSAAACDLIVADIVMPGTWGLELARLGREIRPGLPIVFVSGYPGAISAAIKAGGVPVPKPVSWVRLRRVIEAALADSLLPERD